MKTPRIQQTTDYKMFRRFNSNRQVNKNHLKRLKNSIQAKNLLYLFPIVVNRGLEIVDGRHRLAAARELQLPVFYIMDDDVTQADIAMVNNNRKGWATIDYVNFYREQGHEPYKKLHRLINRYPVNIIGAARLMRKYEGMFSAMGGGGSDSVKLRAGTITDEEYNVALQVLEVAEVLYNHIKYAFRTDLLMDLKRLMVKCGLSKEHCMARLRAGGKVFPKESFASDPETCRILRQVLLDGGGGKGHTEEDVDRILRRK